MLQLAVIILKAMLDIIVVSVMTNKIVCSSKKLGTDFGAESKS